MRKLLLLAAITACTLAAPTPNEHDVKPQQISLQRPSPINPDVPSDPKPAEKITKITDPKEIAKYKRESGNIGQATTQIKKEPETSHQDTEKDKKHDETGSSSSQHHHQKREDAQKATNIASVKPHSTNPDSKSPKTSAPVPASPQKDRPKRDSSNRYMTPQTLPGQPPNQGYVKPKTLEAHIPPQNQQGFRKNIQPNVKVSTVTTPSRTVSKRDIPVPLVPKHKHSDESSEESDEKKPKNEDPKKAEANHQAEEHKTDDSVKNKRESHNAADTSSSTTSTTEQSLLRPNPVPVAELFGSSKQQ